MNQKTSHVRIRVDLMEFPLPLRTLKLPFHASWFSWAGDEPTRENFKRPKKGAPWDARGPLRQGNIARDKPVLADNPEVGVAVGCRDGEIGRAHV